MTRIILDATMREKLENLVQPLELCDEGGRVLAHLTPVHNSTERGLLEPQVGEKELRRREQSDKWHSTEEVLARLQNLEK